MSVVAPDKGRRKGSELGRYLAPASPCAAGSRSYRRKPSLSPSIDLAFVSQLPPGKGEPSGYLQSRLTLARHARGRLMQQRVPVPALRAIRKIFGPAVGLPQKRQEEQGGGIMGKRARSFQNTSRAAGQPQRRSGTKPRPSRSTAAGYKTALQKHVHFDRTGDAGQHKEQHATGGVRSTFMMAC
jgi:hypothetical protein